MAKVQLIGNQTDGYQLTVDREPYFIKGAGLEFGRLKSLSDAGGNTFRTWRVNNGERAAEELLDSAHSLGLKVCMGLDMARERHGFDYSDAAAVEAQNARIMSDVVKLKDHPALLMWGLGNELNLRATDDRVWDAVEALAGDIKTADPNHPTTTMLAGIDRAAISTIAQRAPSLDLLSFQIYGQIDQLPGLLESANFDGAYQITEWGPTGHWESPETDWGRPIEPTSTQKARDIERRYNDIILADSKRCVGAYIFLWGQKQERTPTWYGMFLETGEATEAVDVMERAWSGHGSVDRAPKINALTLNGLEANASVEASVNQPLVAAVDVAAGGNVVISWRIREEVPHELESDGGDYEPTPPTISSLIGTENTRFSFQISDPGEYRLFCQIDSPHRSSAVANIPFRILPMLRPIDQRMSFNQPSGRTAS